MWHATEGEVSAWHYASRQPVTVAWRDGMITRLAAATTPPPQDLWIAPSLFDLQINGYAGVDFQQDELTLEQLLHATHGLRAAGCARYLLTLITDDWHALTARLRRLRALRAQSAELQSAIVGWHVEGPFLSAEPGYCGAHDPARMLDATPEHILELRSLTGQDPVLLTLAPERRGALKMIALAASRGIRVSLGHTNASAETLQRAVLAGATGFTHLGNGCPPELDRHDNILWRVLETPRLLVSLIPDEIHVSPPLFRLMHRILDPTAIYYTTDAMAAAGSPPGLYRIGRLEIQVGEDQVVRLPGKSNLAGSALRPLEGVFRAARMLNRPWPETWARLAEAPARLMGLPNEIAVGQPAVFCVLRILGRNQPGELRTVTPHGISAPVQGDA